MMKLGMKSEWHCRITQIQSKIYCNIVKLEVGQVDRETINPCNDQWSNTSGKILEVCYSPELYEDKGEPHQGLGGFKVSNWIQLFHARAHH